MSMPRSPKSVRLRRLVPSLMLVVAATVGSHADGQQKVPFNNGIPVAPSGLAKKPLPAKPVMYGGKEIRVTASFGVATFPHSARAREEFFPAADKALYRAKKEGRNCVRYAPPILSGKTT